jgi:hypothetical protein
MVSEQIVCILLQVNDFLPENKTFPSAGRFGCPPFAADRDGWLLS